MAEDPQGEVKRDAIRSLRSDQKVYLRFINLTKCTIELVWVNFFGSYIRYKLLRRGEYVDVNTFTTHPWLALEIHTKDRMHICKQYIYMPRPTQEIMKLKSNLREPVVDREKRKICCITTPLYSLRFQSLLILRNYFKTPEEVSALDLPRSVTDDLRKAITIRNKQITTPIYTLG
ncbi:PREDICTED: von Hippel-Lindau tumor suppressor homolog [Nicrophorus vespilloides]|uniref:von Hippel-Lindau tumor suppressor homolog n=1 Tax=Nicrophorus vespilloides TaxID=110193 RepID=A0ABM1N4D5_NICVS|nr:PREDICTED: von Hippel-Lindau tumor suppressor homolog [Nicrophorus vespilloides]